MFKKSFYERPRSSFPFNEIVPKAVWERLLDAHNLQSYIARASIDWIQIGTFTIDTQSTIGSCYFGAVVLFDVVLKIVSFEKYGYDYEWIVEEYYENFKVKSKIIRKGKFAFLFFNQNLKT